MKKLFLALTFCGLLAHMAYGQAPNYFPQLTKIRIDGGMNPVIFGYDKTNIKLSRKKCTQFPKNSPWYCPDPDAPVYERLASFKHPQISDSLYVLFSHGPSEDPNFMIATKSGKNLGTVNGLQLFLTNSTTFYVSGHTNNLFDKRRKFQIKNDTIAEITQPFYYVGLQSVALKELTLYKDKTSKEVVATLPKGYKVEVVMAEFGRPDFELEEHFLVRTDFGLIGWLRLNKNEPWESYIKGLFFAGD
ncbi:hypothetical protein [Runella sp. SP2]|uniref:hypothetical protein n=1 Tax=Runella sp. SP2 TaxID=2268026 RepID=UPI000F088D8F|nr:hypothetical protein [Runella sp. SP2]AYQ35691.1 hypothetical protein DTQ70_27540 [Runella sp. SP2]